MAKIKEFTRGIGSIRESMSEVECIYKVGIVNEKKMVVFSTYGSDSRKKDGASQVLHFDKETAKELIDILKEEFGL